jgi:integrase
MFRIDGNRYTYHVGHTIDPKYWDYKKQRVKNNAGFIDEIVINRALDGVERAFDSAKIQLISEDLSITREAIVRLMDEKLGKKAVLKNDLWGFVDQFIESSKGRVHKGIIITDLTIKKYKNYRNILQRFEKSDNKKMRFDNINYEWFGRFDKWAAKQGYALNTVDRIIGVLKVWLNSAVKQKITTCEDYKNIETVREVSKKIYLTESELLKIHNAELSCECFENARDLFLLGCYTGLRYSDTSTLKPEHINLETNRISLHQAKTGGFVSIPIHPILKVILGKRNWQPPRSLSNQKLNKYIKEVCKEAKLVDTIEMQIIKGGKHQNEIKEKWELVTTHTARRSFASNLYLKGTVRVKTIMKMTGHKTVQAFMSYIQINEEEEFNMVEDTWNNDVVLKDNSPVLREAC